MCAWQVPCVSESILLKHLFVDVMAKAQLSPIIVVDCKKVTVGHGCFVSLIDSIKEGQNVSADKRIVTVDDCNDFS